MAEETVKCKALVSFTHYVSGHGQVHGDPESKDKAAKFPMVPVSVVTLLADGGMIEMPKGFVDPNAPEADDEAPTE